MARSTGAIVRTVAPQDKRHMARHMFPDVEAGIYLRVDGDAT